MRASIYLLRFFSEVVFVCRLVCRGIVGLRWILPRSGVDVFGCVCAF